MKTFWALFSLVLGTGATAVAMNQAPANLSLSASSQQTLNYWRVSARKNFLEGFCVAQTLAGQQVNLQLGQQMDQATVNALKGAIASCKANNNTVVSPAQSIPSQVTPNQPSQPNQLSPPVK